MRTPTTNLGIFLRSRRTLLGLSADQVGRHIGVSRQTISDWELGKGKPNKRKHRKLGEILKLSPEEFSYVFEGGEAPLNATLSNPALRSEEKLRIMDSWKTLEDVLEEQENLADESTVIVASLLCSKEAEDRNIARIVARNLKRRIRYIYAVEKEDSFRETLKYIAEALEEQTGEIPEEIRPMVYRIDRKKDLLEHEDIVMAIGFAAVIFDERGLEIKKENKLRGYMFIEYHSDPDDKDSKEKVFFPIYWKTVIDFVEIIEGGAVQWV